MKTPLPPPQVAAKKPRQRHVFSRFTAVVDGEPWEFTLRADGVHAARPGSKRSERASYPDALAACLKQQTLNLI